MGLVQEDHLLDLEPDGEHGIERGHGLLEDHGYLVAPDPANALLVEAQEIGTLEENPAADDPAGRLGDEPKDGQREHRLSAPGLAHETQRATRAQLEVHSAQGLHHSFGGVEMGVQVLYLEQGVAADGR